jgi:hypothetical protein
MADADKNILITPNRGSTTADPKIEFTGGDDNTVTLTTLDDGTLSFSGSAGQLFSISDSLTGTIFSVNDVSGIPSIEVEDDGTVTLAEFGGNVLVGTNVDSNSHKMQLVSDVSQHPLYIESAFGDKIKLKNTNTSISGNSIDFYNSDDKLTGSVRTSWSSSFKYTELYQNFDTTADQVRTLRLKPGDHPKAVYGATEYSIFNDNYHPNADKLTTTRSIALTGAVTGSANFDGSSNISISTTATADPTLTLTGDVTGSATFTNLGNATLTATVANDSHSHSNYLISTGKAADSNLLDGVDGSGYVRANSTSAGNIDADWGQSFKTFDPIPSGTPPISSPNLRTINIGENYARRTQVAFNYSTNQAWFRRRQDSTWHGWNQFFHTGNDGSGSGLDADLLDGQHASAFLGVSAKAADSSLLDGIGIGSFLRSDATDYLNGVLYVRADIRNETAYRDHGVYGDYDSNKTNHIWSMGSAYRNSASGANFGTLYGLAYKHTNNSTGGTMGGSHQMVWCNNGSPRGSIGYDRVWHASGMRVGSSDVWHAGNDGSGSGLDADLLDGVDISRVVHGNGVNRTDGGDPNTLRPSGFYENYQGNSPTATWYNYINMRHTNAGNGHGHQIAGSFYSAGDLYNRSYSGQGTFTGWARIWNTANDGSGSGLDADLLDGLHASSFWQKSGSWVGTHTDKTRVVGVSSGGGEVWFGYAGGKGNVIVDGEYYASEGNSRVFHDTYHPNADKWTTARTITLSGDLNGSASIDGSANVTLSAQVVNDSHYHSQVYIPDTRGASRAPSYYPDRYASWDFQQNTNTGAGGDSWHVVNTIAKWSGYDASHRQEQVAYTGTNVKHRTATSDSAWGGWATFWDSANDGSGSGLDADLLDGQQGSYYAPASHSHSYLPLTGGTLTGNLNLPRADAITFYGNGSNDHSIMSRSWTGAMTDDIRINSYGGITLNLDSNNNNSSGKGLILGRHGSSTGSVQKFIEVAGETCWTQMYDTSTGTGFTYMSFKNATGATTYGSIYRAYSSMTYATSSDYRLKENIVALTGASERLKQVPVKRFNFIEHPERTVDGFIAHEVQEIVPEAVVGDKDALDEEGNPIYQGVDQSKLVPLLVASLQEALVKIEQLELRINALEN